VQVDTLWRLSRAPKYGIIIADMILVFSNICGEKKITTDIAGQSIREETNYIPYLDKVSNGRLQRRELQYNDI